MRKYSNDHHQFQCGCKNNYKLTKIQSIAKVIIHLFIIINKLKVVEHLSKQTLSTQVKHFQHTHTQRHFQSACPHAQLQDTAVKPSNYVCVFKPLRRGWLVFLLTPNLTATITFLSNLYPTYISAKVQEGLIFRMSKQVLQVNCSKQHILCRNRGF